MVYNIGDRVLVGGNGEAVITDRMYSEKSDKYFYSIKYKGDEDEQENLYDDEVLQPFVEEKVEYDLKMEISEGVVIFSAIEIKGGQAFPCIPWAWAYAQKRPARRTSGGVLGSKKSIHRA